MRLHERVLKLHEDGKAPNDIAAELGIKATSVLAHIRNRAKAAYVVELTPEQKRAVAALRARQSRTRQANKRAKEKRRNPPLFVRVLAMHNAGKKDNEIAKEFKISQSSVAGLISHAKNLDENRERMRKYTAGKREADPGHNDKMRLYMREWRAKQKSKRKKAAPPS